MVWLGKNGLQKSEGWLVVSSSCNQILDSDETLHAWEGKQWVNLIDRLGSEPQSCHWLAVRLWNINQISMNTFAHTKKEYGSQSIFRNSVGMPTRVSSTHRAPGNGTSWADSLYSPKFHCWNRNLQIGSIERWGLWDVCELQGSVWLNFSRVCDWIMRVESLWMQWCPCKRNPREISLLSSR